MRDKKRAQDSDQKEIQNRTKNSNPEALYPNPQEVITNGKRTKTSARVQMLHAS